MDSSNCPTLPNIEILKSEKIHKIKEQIVDLLRNLDQSNPFFRLQRILNALSQKEQSSICSEILFSLLSRSSFYPASATSSAVILGDNNELNLINQMAYEIKYKFLLVLRFCPSAAMIPDSALLHYLVMMEVIDIDALKYVVIAHPNAICQFISLPNYGCLTPLLVLLLKPEIPYEIAFYLLLSCPKAARCGLENGKYPLHLLMAAIFPSSSSSGSICSVLFSSEKEQSFVMRLLQFLLEEAPEISFQEISEEIRFMRLVLVSPGNQETTSPNDDNAPIDNNVSHPVNERQFVMQVEKRIWSPFSRAMQCDNPSVKKLFEKSADCLAKKQLKSQFQRM